MLKLKMAQVVASRPYTVESSIELSRPEASTMLKTDTNTENTFITDYTQARLVGQIHLPQGGAPDYKITCCGNNEAVNAPIPPVKKKHDDNILDPITSFISPAGEFYLHSNKVNIASFGKAKIEPHTTVPQKINSIRKYKEAIDELQ